MAIMFKSRKWTIQAYNANTHKHPWLIQLFRCYWSMGLTGLVNVDAMQCEHQTHIQIQQLSMIGWRTLSVVFNKTIDHDGKQTMIDILLVTIVSNTYNTGSCFTFLYFCLGDELFSFRFKEKKDWFVMSNFKWNGREAHTFKTHTQFVISANQF